MKGLGIALVLLVILLIAFCVFMIAARWKINTKAGRHGWAAIVPVYSDIVALQVAKINPLWVIFPFVASILSNVIHNAVIGAILGIAMIVYYVIVVVRTGQAFGKSGGFIVGMILLPIVFYPILGFGKSQYIFDEVVD